MRLGILILSKHGSTGSVPTQRLVEAGVAAGHTVDVIAETDLLFVDNHILWHDAPLPKFDTILVKPLFSEEPSLHTSTCTLLQNAGYNLVNHLPLATLSKNKLTQRVRLQEANLPMPAWAIARSTEQAERAAVQLGFPAIIKVAFGTHGKGVFYAENKETFLPIADYLLVRDRNPIIIEKFIAEAGRKDLRAFVVGGQVIAAMEREAKANDVRANASIGGVGRAVELTEQEKQIAIKAAQAFDLQIAGVDMLRSNLGPLIIEVNSSPGFEELERSTGINVAAAIIDYLEKQ